MNDRLYKAVVIGASAGGSAVLMQIIPALPENYPIPLIVVQHLHPQQPATAMVYHCKNCKVKIKEAEEKEAIQPGYVYFAPPNYHLLIEYNGIFSLSVDPKVNYTRPSIDVTFESAADVYRSALVGIILTGANNDGAYGLGCVKQRGGLTIVQDPATAEANIMPLAAIGAAQPDHVLKPKDIASLLLKLGRE